MSSLIHVVIVLVVAGLLLWLINRFIPMQSMIKMLLNLVVVIVIILWLLKVFGIWGGGHVNL
ncbi:Thivi_2564 family membrane protein [Flaviaesturariibacter terrae]